MSNEIARRISAPSNPVSQWFEPGIVKQGRQVKGEGQIVDLKAKVVQAVTASFMYSMRELHDIRNALSTGDVEFDMTLAVLEGTATRKGVRLIDGMFGPLG